MNGRLAKFFREGIPKNRCMMSKWSVGYFESRGNWGAFESDSGRRASARVWLDMKKIVQMGGLAKLKCFVGNWDNFVVNALINFEPMSWFENMWNTGESRSFRNSTSSRVENQLKTIKLSEEGWERVAIVYLVLNERCSDSFSWSTIKSISDSTKVMNRHKSRFRYIGWYTSSINRATGGKHS